MKSKNCYNNLTPGIIKPDHSEINNFLCFWCYGSLSCQTEWLGAGWHLHISQPEAWVLVRVDFEHPVSVTTKCNFHSTYFEVHPCWALWAMCRVAPSWRSPLDSTVPSGPHDQEFSSTQHNI